MGSEHLLWIGLGIAALAFVAEYIDSTLGMGYGTALTPALLLMGFEPMQVVPAILLSELFTGCVAGVAHHRAGNAAFLPTSKGPKGEARRLGLPRDLCVVALIASCSIMGTLGAVMLAVHLNAFFLKLYIGVMVLLIGLFILLRRNCEHRFSWGRLVGLGLLASFNKGVSGGGYGPVVTGGQILSGVQSRNAVAITSLAEGLTCLVGFAAYWLSGNLHLWAMTPFLCGGALLATPLAARAVKAISTRKLTVAIGAVSTCLGLLTLARVLL